MRIHHRLAGAPISWGVCEVPGWGLELPPSRVLAEMAGLGLTATELGPTGYLPTDPDELRALLDGHGVRLVAGFVPVVLHDPARLEATLHAATAPARTLAAGGADVFVSAVVLDQSWASRVPLDAEDWGHLVAGLARLDALAADHGLVHALHPHVGTLVETAEEVRRVLESSDVGWCLDSGHLLIGGTDPVKFAAEAADRVRHVHLKDVRGEVAARLRKGELTLVEATRAGLFCPLGQGDARVDDTIAALERSSYDRWYVLEQDAALTGSEPPAGSGPVDDVRASVAHLARLFEDPPWVADAAAQGRSTTTTRGAMP
jgi:inosose dehydratase